MENPFIKVMSKNGSQGIQDLDTSMFSSPLTQVSAKKQKMEETKHVQVSLQCIELNLKPQS